MQEFPVPSPGEIGKRRASGWRRIISRTRAAQRSARSRFDMQYWTTQGFASVMRVPSLRIAKKSGRVFANSSSETSPEHMLWSTPISFFQQPSEYVQCVRVV